MVGAECGSSLCANGLARRLWKGFTLGALRIIWVETKKSSSKNVLHQQEVLLHLFSSDLERRTKWPRFPDEDFFRIRLNRWSYWIREGNSNPARLRRHRISNLHYVTDRKIGSEGVQLLHVQWLVWYVLTGISEERSQHLVECLSFGIKTLLMLAPPDLRQRGHCKRCVGHYCVFLCLHIH